MTTIEKITTVDFLKEIYKKIKPSNTKGITISHPLFVFDKPEKESHLAKLIVKLEEEIFFDENGE